MCYGAFYACYSSIITPRGVPNKLEALEDEMNNSINIVII